MNTGFASSIGKKIGASLKASFVLPLLFLGVGGQVPIVAQSRGTFTATGNMSTARVQHTATVLADGRVLIAGGTSTSSYPASGYSVLASAELYDPSTGAFTPTGSMTTARYAHTATVLADGRVLIVGGLGPEPDGLFYSADIPLFTAELYDPSTGTFSATGDMIPTTVGTATLLPSGKVLIVGGESPPSIGGIAEIYDPSTGTFEATGPYAGGVWRWGSLADFTASSLPDGRVLIAGGGATFDYWGGAVSQLYDPGSGTFSLTGTMFAQPDSWVASTATLLMNGKVLIAGGADDLRMSSSSARLYDPSTGTFNAAGNMTAGRISHTATLLSNGTVLVTGGGGPGYYQDRLAGAEIYDPATNSFSVAGDMTMPRFFHTATLLRDGTVLITGGGTGYYASTSSAELYKVAP
jgi:hypothetical protein